MAVHAHVTAPAGKAHAPAMRPDACLPQQPEWPARRSADRRNPAPALPRWPVPREHAYYVYHTTRVGAALLLKMKASCSRTPWQHCRADTATHQNQWPVGQPGAESVVFVRPSAPTTTRSTCAVHGADALLRVRYVTWQHVGVGRLSCRADAAASRGFPRSRIPSFPKRTSTASLGCPTTMRRSSWLRRKR